MSRLDGYRITSVVTPADSLALVTLDQAKDALGIPSADTSHDTALTAQIAQVSTAINNYCDRIFVVQGYRDQLRFACNSLRWGEPLVTRQFPIGVAGGVPVVAITQDGIAIDPTLFEVYPETGRLYLLDAGGIGSWTGSTIVVDYDAGFDPIPDDVQGAALEWLTGRWAARGRDPMLRSETIPDVIAQSYDTAAASEIPGGVRDWLATYRRWYV
jgi:hypothetical protein